MTKQELQRQMAEQQQDRAMSVWKQMEQMERLSRVSRAMGDAMMRGSVQSVLDDRRVEPDDPCSPLYLDGMI